MVIDGQFGLSALSHVNFTSADDDWRPWIVRMADSFCEWIENFGGRQEAEKTKKKSVTERRRALKITTNRVTTKTGCTGC
jgi:hypothetical protein